MNPLSLIKNYSVCSEYHGTTHDDTTSLNPEEDGDIWRRLSALLVITHEAVTLGRPSIEVITNTIGALWGLFPAGQKERFVDSIRWNWKSSTLKVRVTVSEVCHETKADNMSSLVLIFKVNQLLFLQLIFVCQSYDSTDFMINIGWYFYSKETLWYNKTFITYSWKERVQGFVF